MIIGTNFKLSSRKFLDDRQYCKSYNELVENKNNILYPPGFEVYCEDKKKYYQYISDIDGNFSWQERVSASNGEGGSGASIDDTKISNTTTWSSAYITQEIMELENLISNAEDYVDEIEERMTFIEGKFQWFEYFDGSYESLKDKPVIPTKVSELENDSLFIDETILGETVENINTSLDGKVDKEIDMSLIPISELERLKELGNYNDTAIQERLTEVENKTHTHTNEEILQSITEERINQWDSNSGGIDDYNYLLNKPITKVGDDSSIFLSASSVIDDGLYLVTAKIGEYELYNELVDVYHADDNNATMVLFGLLKKLTLTRQDTNIFEIVKEVNYEIDKENAEINKSLTVGELLNIGEGNIANENNQLVQGKFNEEDTEGKYINIIGNGENEGNRKNIHTLDWEGNGWYGGKLSQEGTPTEDKDLVTKGYVDGKFATTENVNNQINTINTRMDNMDKENAKRDVIIETLANGRRRTVESNGNDVDLLFSTERDTVWIDKIEGRTLVNVCDQKEPIAVTKSYTVENESHIPLQGEYDGKAKPVVYGNTLVNRNIEYNESLIVGKEVNRQGTEILNIEGTKESEVSVKLEGHTAINLATKKGGELCRTFPSASGNKIDLITDKNSRTDVVLEGNTMVNIGYTDYEVAGALSELDGWILYFYSLNAYSLYDRIQSNSKYTIVLLDAIPEIDKIFFMGKTTDAIDIAPGVKVTCGTVPNEPTYQYIHFYLGDNYSNPKYTLNDFKNMKFMVFEGDLTQTPELIPTEYVEGIQSTFEDKLIPYSIYDGSQLTALTETQYQLPLSVKANTQYTIVTTANTTKYQYAVYSSDNLNEYFSYNDTVSSATFTSGVENILFKVRMNPSYGGEDYSFVLSEVQDKFMIVEGDWTNRLDLLTDEYFGKYRVDMESHGKNLFDINKYPFKEGYELKNSNTDTGGYGEVTSRTLMFAIKPNTTYTYSIDITVSNNVGSVELFALLYEDSKATAAIRVNQTSWVPDSTEVARKSLTFTTPDIEGLYCELRVDNNLSTDGNESIVSFANIQLEEGTQATEYEPYCGTSKTIYLNSPLHKGDELVMKDGKLCHYHKMGKVVFNGSEEWILAGSDNYGNTTIAFYTYDNIMKPLGLITSDKFTKAIGMDDAYLNKEQEICLGGFDVVPGYNGTVTFIRISRSKLSTTDVNGFKQWLSENPTTVVYELAEPWYEPIGAYGKVVLDGSSDENWINNGNITNGGIKYASSSVLLEQGILKRKYICDIFTTPFSGEERNQNAFTSYGQLICHGSSQYSNNIYISTELPIEEFKQSLRENPATIIYELANPQYITEDMIFDIATTSTLEYQSAVPMANTTFKQYIDELNILESSTQYRVIFDCDVEGLALEVSLGGTSQVIDSQLTNNISFVTPSLQTNGKLIINGSGMANIDNVRITKGEMVYPYFEGLKSSFEENRINLYDMNKIEVDNNPNAGDYKITSDGHMLLKTTSGWQGFKINDLSGFKENTEYIIKVNVYKNELVGDECLYITSNVSGSQTDKDIFFMEGEEINLKQGDIGEFIYYRTSLSDFSNCECVLRTVLNVQKNVEKIECTIEIYEVNKRSVKIKLSSNDFYFGKGGRI